MKNQPTILHVKNVFNNVEYVIPIYQRNYAWGQEEIEQLLDDIHTSEGNYFLGTLIVNKLEDDILEVIDGQQRLTTLFLLLSYLKLNNDKGALRFEAREKSNRILKSLEFHHENMEPNEIVQGYNLIKNFFEFNSINRQQFIDKLESVQLIRIQVPTDIDLNHYFEIMNTRGEQLENHEIVKARILGQLHSESDKKIGAIIWDACARMDSYVQMNFNIKIREELFSKKWDALIPSIKSFDNLSILNKLLDKQENEKASVLNIMKGHAKSLDKNKEEEENERFEPIITFPNFLLQVNKTLMKSLEEESSLDDRNFLTILEENWKNEESSKLFLFNLLKCRVLFDRYILKREYSKDYKDVGKWSLQKLVSYKENAKSSLKPKYIGTFTEAENKLVRTLQACLRITYTSPKTMHWISLVLRSLLDDEKVNLITILENYCKSKVKQADYKNKVGFNVERIVFTYLDYILFRDYLNKGKKITGMTVKFDSKWDFQFRNSIEHFYPQNIVKQADFVKWSSPDLNNFGNLALINVSGNSKFSNLPPLGKIESFKTVVHQSLKLQIMAQIARENNDWSETLAEKHGKDMMLLLDEECARNDIVN